MVQWHYNFIVVIRLENLLNGTGRKFFFVILYLFFTVRGWMKHCVCSTKTENWMKVKVKRSRRYGNKHALNIG